MKINASQYGFTPRWRFFFAGCMLLISLFFVALILNIPNMHEISYQGNVFIQGESGFSDAKKSYLFVITLMGMSAFVFSILLFLWGLFGLRCSSEKTTPKEQIIEMGETVLSGDKGSYQWRIRAIMAGFGIHGASCILFVVIILIFDLGTSLDNMIIPLYMLLGWIPLVPFLRRIFKKHLR